MPEHDPFTFEISLSVLNHLGRNLYRSFITVLGEAISNAWDADAQNVWIWIDRDANRFVIKDDGIGMTRDDFQNKFLKIGYSKRKEGVTRSERGRAFIGRKGIGKLALLSCADRIAVVSRVAGGELVGGVIDNADLDEAINDDLVAERYPLDDWREEKIEEFTKDLTHGTVVYFEGIKEGIKNTLEYLKRTVALYFKFSLLDNSFDIYIGGEKITLDHLVGLSDKTEFTWKINDLVDPYVDQKLSKLKEPVKQLTTQPDVRGFVSSVEKPRDLKIITTDERVSIDLFVNGRLRERDILKHMSTARVAENYLYGQIHFDSLDDGVDRFTSSREGIVSDDPKYKEFLERFKKEVLAVVLEDWDSFRRRHREDGDSESEAIPKRERKAQELYNVVAHDFDLPAESLNRDKISAWVDELGSDAKFNFASYAECFISENLIRKFIHDRNFALSDSAKKEIAEFKRRELQNKQNGNVNIDLRKRNDDCSYLDMQGLANLVDKRADQNCLPADAKQYRPIRDALMHTALLTEEAKRRLTAVYDNMKARLKILLS